MSVRKREEEIKKRLEEAKRKDENKEVYSLIDRLKTSGNTFLHYGDCGCGC